MMPSPTDLPLVLHPRVISGQGGGPEKTILNSPRFLEPLGYQAACLYLRDPHDDGFEIIRQRAGQTHAPLIEIDDFGPRDWKIVGRCKAAVEETLKRFSADDDFIWHGHDYKSNLIGLLLRKSFPKMQLVSTVHGWVQRTWKTPIYFAIDRWCLKRYQQVICVSQDLYQDCQKLGLPETRLSLIDNAIALGDYQVDYSQADAKQQLGLNEDAFLIAGVGRLSDEKGFDLLIQAIAELSQSGKNVALRIAGDGAFRDALQQQIDQLNLGNRIELLGFVADPRLLYQACDTFVLSSFREGLPNVVLEAMAMKRPVVSTRVAGIPKLVVDGDNGILIHSGDHKQIKDAVQIMLEDPETRQRIAASGYETVSSKFSLQVRMDKIAAIYKKLSTTPFDCP